MYSVHTSALYGAVCIRRDEIDGAAKTRLNSGTEQSNLRTSTLRRKRKMDPQNRRPANWNSRTIRLRQGYFGPSPYFLPLFEHREPLYPLQSQDRSPPLPQHPPPFEIWESLRLREIDQEDPQPFDERLPRRIRNLFQGGWQNLEEAWHEGPIQQQPYHHRSAPLVPRELEHRLPEELSHHIQAFWEGVNRDSLPQYHLRQQPSQESPAPSEARASEPLSHRTQDFREELNQDPFPEDGLRPSLPPRRPAPPEAREPEASGVRNILDEMVQLVEVEDEHFQNPQPGPENEDDDFTDTGTLELKVGFS